MSDIATEGTGEAANDSGPSVARSAGEARSAKGPKKRKLPRARAAAVSAEAAGLPVSRFGAVPEGVTHWRARRRNLSGNWDACGHVPPGAIVEERDFPLAELSEKTIADRWGPGVYEVSWVRFLENGGRNALRGTCELRIVDAAPAPAEPAAATPAPASPFGESFTLAMQIMQMIDSQSQAKLDAQVQMAQLFAGQKTGGLGAAELQLILQSNAAATEKAIAAAVAPLHARIEALSDDDDDDDDDGPGIADAARAAAPLIKGKGTLASVLNFASANPKIVEAGLPIVANAFSALASLVATAKPSTPPPAAAAPPPAPLPRPRAVPAPEEPSQPSQSSGSLSDWQTRDPKPEPAKVEAAASS